MGNECYGILVKQEDGSFVWLKKTDGTIIWYPSLNAAKAHVQDSANFNSRNKLKETRTFVAREICPTPESSDQA